MNPRWWAWREQVFGDSHEIWRNGVYFDGLLVRFNADSEDVATMLAIGIADEDYVAALSIAELARLGLAQTQFVDLVGKAVPNSAGRFRVSVGQALLALTGDEPAAAELILSVLKTADSRDDRLDAAIALAFLTPTGHLVQSLGQAVARDPDYFVRYHAANALLRYAGRDEGISVELVDLIGSRASPAKWRRAAEVLAQPFRDA
ncbi:hypothetical protein FZI91_03020 [Mycobacterium sp. CBMA271]|uniref:hypothetical protein n=1 Tax=unclassified Mycobacteroides TaxID=2618759 RepID=UPI0012DC9338|nr:MULTISPECIES: hypothetical protein [unclassified Mycobacteroides]MUM16378.1 hypothetical protein [Mycobacteroides sp. CBMA 326]MUM20679.1 hypothetical protein [Mycobacteroides sp. CBMA 271]